MFLENIYTIHLCVHSILLCLVRYTQPLLSSYIFFGKSTNFQVWFYFCNDNISSSIVSFQLSAFLDITASSYVFGWTLHCKKNSSLNFKGFLIFALSFKLIWLCFWSSSSWLYSEKFCYFIMLSSSTWFSE